MNTRLLSVFGGLAVLALAAAACGGSESAAGSTGGIANDALAAALAQDNGNAASGLSVSGHGVAAAEPDIASLTLGVSTLRDTARESRDAAAESMTALINSLKDNGVAEKDYHTSQFSINPEIDYRPNGQQVIRGYRVTSMLAVTVRDLDRVGEVIDEAVDAVGDPIQVQGVTFSIEDPAALMAEARTLAMTDAKTKAESLAELAEVELGKPVSISESSGGGIPPVYVELAAIPASGSTPVSPGQLEITVDVQVTYAIS